MIDYGSIYDTGVRTGLQNRVVGVIIHRWVRFPYASAILKIGGCIMKNGKFFDITQFSSCGGWVGKLGPGALDEIMKKLPLQADTLCVHGDTENALELIKALKSLWR